MREMTDKTIIVKCGECSVEATGIDAMMSHILDFHTEYSPVEARNFAEIWTEGAHHKYEDVQREETEDGFSRGFNRAKERSIEADAFPNK